MGYTINPDDAPEISYSRDLEGDSNTVDVVLGHQSFDDEIVRFVYVVLLLFVFQNQQQLVVIVSSHHRHEEFGLQEAVELPHANHFQEVEHVQNFEPVDLANQTERKPDNEVFFELAFQIMLDYLVQVPDILVIVPFFLDCHEEFGQHVQQEHQLAHP